MWLSPYFKTDGFFFSPVDLASASAFNLSFFFYFVSG